MQENQEMKVQSLGWENLLEEAMVTHSSILVWKIPGTEEPGRIQSLGSQESETAEQLSAAQHMVFLRDTYSLVG